MCLSNREIAEVLVKISELFPEKCEFDAEKFTVLCVGNLKLKCQPSKTAILKMAKRFSHPRDLYKTLQIFKLPNKIPIHRESKSVISNRYRDDCDLMEFENLFKDTK